MRLHKPILELVNRASTQLPADVLKVIQRQRGEEEPGSRARGILTTVEKNIRLARRNATPVCQDTGIPVFSVSHPMEMGQEEIITAIKWVVRQATMKNVLRPDAVDSITGVNTGNNIGHGFPAIHLHQWGRQFLKVGLLLKNCGSERLSRQYSLPDDRLDAGRGLEGVRRCVLDTVFRAQGRGCAPGVLGVSIGGTRASGFRMADQQFFRKLDDENQQPLLARLEEDLLRQCNELGIGPMGLGGRSTVLAVKIGQEHRLPSSCYVSVSWMCWACRRKTMKLYPDGEARYA
jgi:fumarate hydratase class I